MKKDCFNLINDSMDEYFESQGIPKDFLKKLMDLFDSDKKTLSKIDSIFLEDEYYNQDEYNVFVYDTCIYPPNSNPPKTLN